MKKERSHFTTAQMRELRAVIREELERRLGPRRKQSRGPQEFSTQRNEAAVAVISLVRRARRSYGRPVTVSDMLSVVESSELPVLLAHLEFFVPLSTEPGRALGYAIRALRRHPEYSRFLVREGQARGFGVLWSDATT